MALTLQESRQKQKEIEEDIKRIKQEQQKQSLESIKKIAKKRQDKEAFSNIEQIQKKKGFIDTTEQKYIQQTQETRRKSRDAGFVSIDPSVQPKTLTAKEVVGQARLRAGFPASTVLAGTPSSSRVSLTPVIESRVQKAPPTDISKGFERRIENLLGREQKIQETEEAIFEKLKISREEGEPFLTGLGKVVAQTPFKLVSTAAFVGGRIPFAIESTTTKAGRKELGISREQLNIFSETSNPFRQDEVGKAIVESLDPRTPEGLVNIGLSVLAVKGIGKARAAKRARTSFVTEEAVTKRFTTKDFTLDETFIDVEALVGKKKVSIKGRGTQTFQEIGTDTFGVKGKAALTELSSKKVTKVDTRGVAKKVEGGFDVTSVSKVGKSKTILDITQSAKLISEPTQVFKTISRTAEIPKGKSIFDITPKRVSSGVTGEIFIEDIVSGKGRSIFRKDVLSESGRPISIEQTLATDRFSISAKQASQQFKDISRTRDLSKTFKERQSFRPIESGTSVTKLEQIVQTKQLPTQSSTLINIAKDKAMQVSSQIKGQQVSKGVTQATVGTSINVAKLQTTLPSTTSFDVGIIQKTTPLPVSLGLTTTPQKSIVRTTPLIKPSVTSRPIIDTKPAVSIRSITKPTTKSMLETRSIIDVRPTVQTKPLITPKQASDVRPVIEPRQTFKPFFRGEFGVNPTPPPSPPFIPIPFGAGSFSFKESESLFKPKKKVSKTLELPSVESLVFNIRSKKFPKLQAATGLGTRPIKIR